jgi:hypothetical protein
LRDPEVTADVSFARQPNTWLCGPFALKHALLLLGLSADEQRIARLAGSDHRGTDELELARAARHFGCELQTIRCRDPERARQTLTTHLGDRKPVLLCIEQWDHWVVAAHEDDGTFVIIDSRAAAIFRVLPWEYLRDLLVYREGRRGRELYDLHPLAPLRDTGLRPALTIDRARFLQEWDHQEVARHWSRFLTDAQEVTGGLNGHEAAALSPGEFFGRHEPALLDAVASGNQSGQRSRARRLLHGMRFLADAYGLRVAKSQEPHAVRRLESLLRRRLELVADRD